MTKFQKILIGIFGLFALSLAAVTFGIKTSQAPTEVLAGGLTKLRIGQQVDWTTDLKPSVSFNNINLGSSTQRILGYFGTTASLSTNLEVGGLASIGNPNASNSFKGSLSVSKGITGNSYQGGGLGACSGSSFLQYAAGQFGCGSPAGSGTVTSTAGSVATEVAFFNANTVVSGSALFQWDTVNKRLGIGKATPLVALDVTGAASVSSNVEFGGTASVGGKTFLNNTASISGNVEFGADKLHFDSTNGRLGIGTVTLNSELLEVGGTASASVLVAQGFFLASINNLRGTYTGSAALSDGDPLYSFNGDTDTGWNGRSAGNIVVGVTNGVSRMLIYPSGRVAIASNKSDAPSSLLELASSSANPIISVGVGSGLSNQYLLDIHNTVSTNGTGSGIAFADTSITTDHTIGSSIIFRRTGGNSQGGLEFYTKGDANAGTNLLARLIIADNGKVGLGFNALTPDAPLEIASQSSGIMLMLRNLTALSSSSIELDPSGGASTSNENKWTIEAGGATSTAGEKLSFKNNLSIAVLTLASNSFVGIGKSTPLVALDVVGNASISSNLEIGNYASISIGRILSQFFPPNSVTLTTAGQIAFNQASKSLATYVTEQRNIRTDVCFNFNIYTPTTTTQGKGKKFTDPFTITKVISEASKSSPFGWTLMYGNPGSVNNNLFSANKSASNSITEATYTAFAQATLTDGQDLQPKVTSASANSGGSQITVCGYY